jgi:hypothetical protein
MNDRRADRVWRRLAIAAPLSLLVHFLVIMLSRPAYHAVSDVAVALDVLEAAPGPPPKAPEPPEEPAAPAPAPKAPPPDDGIAMPKEAAAKREPSGADAGVAAAEVADAGPRAVAEAEADAGAGEGGICLHDLFPYAPVDPSWLAWVSMSSFRGTELESGFSRLLSAFTLYRETAGATGLDPGKDVEGFLVTADPFDDASSYRVIATYDSGQEALLGALRKSSQGAAGFSLAEAADGYEAVVPGAYRWSLVGSGRVLVATPEPALSAVSTGTAPATDAGPIAAKAKGHREWPKEVTCLVPAAPTKRKALAALPLGAVVRSLIGPDSGGHWPALVIATRDPRALGLPRSAQLQAKFLWAYAEVRFSEPMRVEGTVTLDGTGEQVEAVAAGWRSMLAAAGSDPLLALAGLNGLVGEVKLERDGDRIRFSLPLTSRQIQAALLMLEMQAGAVDRQILRKSKR